MSDVYLRHPDLPPDQWIEVPTESRAHYSTSGWQLVPDEDVRARADAAAHVLATAEAQMAGLPLPPAPTPEPTQEPAAEPQNPADAEPAQDPSAGPDATTTTAPAAPKRSK